MQPMMVSVPGRKGKAEALYAGKCACGQGVFINEMHRLVVHGQPWCSEFRNMMTKKFLVYFLRTRK